MRSADGVLLDLLMGVMDSLEVWVGAAGDRDLGLAWRDAVTKRMASSSAYAPYEYLVADAASEVGVPVGANAALLERWQEMEPWPDSATLTDLNVPYAFVTNCSTELATIAARRSRLRPRFVLSAQEAGRYKPDALVYGAACDRLGTVPERTLFIAGSPYDAEGAIAVGLQACLVIRRPDHRAAAPSIPRIESLADVAAALGDDGAR